MKKHSIPENILAGGALDGNRQRVIVSTDIGGTDPDDFQSMVHLLLYADVIDVEGLISSSGLGGGGLKEDILQVLDYYEEDYESLKNLSSSYPLPDTLRACTKQGATEVPPYIGVSSPTEGSEWIIRCARRADPRPLNILGWGGIEDIAQALHDAPDILPKLRVHWVGGPNKKWGPNQYQYIVENHPDLWIIESNATYRGWFTGGDQSGHWGNKEFVKRYIASHGSLGQYFANILDGSIKMGDTPTVAWLLKGNPGDPTSLSWGGQFTRTWNRPVLRLNRLPEINDQMEIFSILEISLVLPDAYRDISKTWIKVENQSLSGHKTGDGKVIFRFCPKAAQVFHFTINSDISVLNGNMGAISVYLPGPEVIEHPSEQLPNWWTDIPLPEYSEEMHHGAKTVSRWRHDYLSDFARRINFL